MEYCLPLHQITSEDALNALRDIRRDAGDAGGGSGCSRLLLLSENESVCRSFLFQSAVSLSGMGRSTMYVCRKPLLAEPPGIHGMLAADYRTVQMLRFTYLPTLRELLDFLTGMHCLSPGELPDCLILEDLTGYAVPFATAGTRSAIGPSELTDVQGENRGFFPDRRRALSQVTSLLLTCLDDAANFLCSRNKEFSLTVSGCRDAFSSFVDGLCVLRSFVIGMIEDHDDGSVTVKLSVAANQLQQQQQRAQVAVASSAAVHQPQHPIHVTAAPAAVGHTSEQLLQLPADVTDEPSTAAGLLQKQQQQQSADVAIHEMVAAAAGQHLQQPVVSDPLSEAPLSLSPTGGYRLCFTFRRFDRKATVKRSLLHLCEVAQPMRKRIS